MQKYKENLIEKMGGKAQYDFAIIKYCESIQSNPRVIFFFEKLSLTELIDLQKQLLDAAFLDLPQAEFQALLKSLALKCHFLWRMGLNERYFEVMKDDFLEALRDCWVEENVVQLFERHYEGLRPMFQNNGCVMLDDELYENASTGRFQLIVQHPVQYSSGIKQV